MADTANDSAIAERLESIMDPKPSGESDDGKSLEEVKKVKPTKPKDKLFIDNAKDDENDDDVEDAEGDTDADNDVDDNDDDDNNNEDVSLASYLGLSESQLTEDGDGKILFNANIDGKIVPIPIEKLVQGYQTDAYNTDRSEKLSKSYKDFESERDSVIKVTQDNLQASLLVAGEMEKDLLSDFNAVDWNGLKASDATQFMVMRQEFADKANKLESMKAGAQESIKKFQEETYSRNMQQQGQHIAEERTKLIQSIPALSDSDQFTKVMTSAKAFLKSKYGIEEDDSSKIFDHRLVRIILDAQKFHSGKQEVIKKDKEGKKIPKFQKSGVRRSKQNENVKSRNAKRSRLKTSGSTADAANLLVDRM